ncbi:MAG: RNA polymerase sigma factor [Peptococcaceae bacterium]
MVCVDDLELIQKINSGNRECYGELVDRYKRQIFNLACKFTHDYSQAQDLSQEVFVHCFLQLGSFKENAKFSTWLYRLAVNKCIDWQRKNKREPQFVELIDIVEHRDDGSPEEIYLKKERELWLKNTVLSLPEKYKIVLLLYIKQDLTYGEIGEILNLPVKTVETRIYRAKKLIKKKLNPEQEVVNNELSSDKT